MPDINVVSVSSTTATIVWNNSFAIPFRPVWFTVTYYSITCYNQSTSEHLNEDIEVISIDIEPGQSYKINVMATNRIGDSNVTTLNYSTPTQSLLKLSLC